MNIMDFNMNRALSSAGPCSSQKSLAKQRRQNWMLTWKTSLAKLNAPKYGQEKIMKQTEVLLQPNPNARIEEFIYEKLDRKAPSSINNPELLGQYMIDAGTEFGPETAYGNALIKCGETQKQIGTADRELIQTSALNFLTPLRNFIEGDYKQSQKKGNYYRIGDWIWMLQKQD